MRTTIRVICFALAALPLCLGCATRNKQAEALPTPATPNAMLQAGDVVNVKFLYWPELDEEQAIRPDGKLSLQMVGEVQAEGLTPEQVRAHLLELYTDKINNPEINVVVRSFDSQRVYVGGEVKAPGLVPLKRQLTVLQAIVQAGGVVNESAKLSNVIIVRQADGNQERYSVDLTRAIHGEDKEPFYLAPCDVVYVPRTVIDKLDQWVDQHLNKLIPRNINYSFNNVVGDSRSSSRTSPVQIQLPSIR